MSAPWKPRDTDKVEIWKCEQRTNQLSGLTHLKQLSATSFSESFVMNSVWRAQLPQSSPMSPKTPGRKAPSGNLALFWRFLSLYLAKWNIYNGFLYLYSEQPHTNFVMFLSQAHCLEFCKRFRNNIWTKQKRLCTISYFALLAKSSVFAPYLLAALFTLSTLALTQIWTEIVNKQKTKEPQNTTYHQRILFFLQINHFWKVWKENERKN